MKSTLILAIFLVFSMSLATRECPNDGYKWLQRGNKCYLFKTEKGDLYENVAFCNQFNASLVSITNDDENIQVTQLRPSDSQFWLGLGQRSNDSKEFYWFDGSPFIYESWVEEPNVTNQYFGAYFQDGDWFIGSAVMQNIQVCSVDLTLNAPPKKTPIPAELTGLCNNTGWRRVGLKCFFCDRNERITYKQNHALCKNMNATMVSIHSKNEDIQITRLSGYEQFWIGLKQISRKDKLYKWEDGSVKTYENWWEYEPNNLGRKYWAAFSQPIRFPYLGLGGWKDTRSYSVNIPCCQTSLLTHAEQVSSEMTN